MNIKNISILAHVDAGKTSLTEALLNESGSKQHFGSVDDGTTVTDTNQLEIERGISIYTSTTSTYYKNTKINIIDTPGHMDFINEVEQALLATDLAILVIAANDNTIKSQTVEVYHKLVELDIPTIIFLNKIDIKSSEIEDTVERIYKLTNKSVCLDDLKQSTEFLAMNDDHFLEKVLLETNSEKDFSESLVKAINNLKCVPILKGSAIKKWGITELLDLIASVPNPSDDHQLLSAIVYKKQFNDDRLQSFVRIFSGQLNTFDTITINEDERFKINNMFKAEEGHIIKTDYVPAGDIAIIEGLDLDIGVWIGQPLSDKKIPIWTSGQYTLTLTYEAGKRVSVLEALNKIIKVNPFIKYRIDEVNQDIILILVGEVQKDVIKSTFMSDYNLNVSLGPITIINKITPKQPLTDTVIMNTVENPYWATMTFHMEPLKRNSGVQYETLINTGYLRQSFQNAISQSIQSLIDTPYKGQYLTDYKLTLTFAEFASPVSTPSDFRHSTIILFNKIMKQVEFYTIQPYCDFELNVPEHSLRRAYHELNNLEATISNTVFKDDLYCITGRMLLKHSINYEAKVLGYTEGTGSFSIK